MRNYKILQKLMKFHETNRISVNFIGIIFYFCSFAMYFVDFCYSFQKLIAKFQFHLDRFEISKFQTWRWPKLKKSILQLPKLFSSIQGSLTEVEVSVQLTSSWQLV